jgi:acyl-CoA thioesterase-1
LKQRLHCLQKKHEEAFVKIFVLVLNMLFAQSVFADKSVTVLFLGDSLTEGYGLSKEQAFPALVEKRLQDKKIQISAINAGISGSTSVSGESRLKWHLKGKERPEVLVLALGSNDGLRGLPVAEAKKNLNKTIKLAKENSIEVLLVGMKMPPNLGEKYTREFEAMFRDLAKEHGIPLVPFLLENVAGEAKLNQADGIHPTAAGQSIIADTVVKHLVPMLKKGA